MKKINKLLVLLLSAVLLLGLTSPAGAAGGKINGSVVNVRSGPGTTYAVAGTIYQDTEVEVLKQSDGWDQIKYGSLTGWVSASFITPSATVKITGEYVNLRSGPDTTYPIIGKVVSGDVLTLTGEKDGWYTVKTDNLPSAYLSASLAQKENSAPAANPSPATTAPAAGASNSSGLRVLLNGQQLSFDVAPLIDSGRTLVPLRAIFEAMGVTVNWDPASITVTASKGSDKVVLPVGSRVATVNGKSVVLDVPAKIINSRTLVPLRFVSESFGAQVDWNAAQQLITITARAAGSQISAVTITEDQVNLRSGPATSYAQVGTARSGERLAVLGESNGWYQVSRGGSTVWVAGWLVSPSQSGNGDVTPAPDPNPEPEPEPEPKPDPQPTNTISLARTRDENGLAITITGGQRLGGSSHKENGKLIYEFKDMQVKGLNYFKEDLGNGSAVVRGTNDGSDATVTIELPSGVKCSASTAKDGKEETILVPNYIVSVESKPFGSVGERLIITTMAPVKYSGTLKGDQLEVKLPNLLMGRANSSYSYGGSILKKADLTSTGTSDKNLLVTLTTADLGKYSFGQSGDSNNLNIILLKKSQPRNLSGVVVLDPGHGGKDNGASGPSGLHEKNVNLAVALQAGKLLEAKGVKVEYTRKDDSFVELDDLSAFANRLNADLYVSIHCNSALNSAANGTESYTFTSMDYPELYIQQDERKRLATLLQDNVMAKLKRTNRGVKEGNFSVLRKTQMPAALVEMSFISNPTEEQLLASEDYQALAAQGIADAICNYINK